MFLQRLCSRLFWRKSSYSTQKFKTSVAHYATMRVPKRGNNILLMGSPGAGKTVVAQCLSEELDIPVIDVDDHVLERKWGMPVAEKLFKIGGEAFVEEEAKAFMNFKADHAIISMTGSQPLSDEAMEHAKKLGLIVYLDTHSDDILNRLFLMKLNRIVGQEEGQDLATILEYRQQFYEKHYDLRVICERKESPQSVANKVIKIIHRYYNEKGFVSTRSRGSISSFLDVTLEGLASDRGLYVSNTDFPKLTTGQWERLVGLSYNECALRILEQWVPPSEMPQQDLKRLIDRAYNSENFSSSDISPVVLLEHNQYLLELFHGPTASFKDMALQLTPMLFDYAATRKHTGQRYVVLVATSGDTGGAVLNGFSRHAACSDVIVLFPENGVSSIQKAQLTSLHSDKASVYGVKGDFDFCQTVIKNIFTDQPYAKRIAGEFGYALSAANSINFARLLPQVVYHAWSYLTLVRDDHIQMGDKIDVVVPTGNFGNILGAYYVKRMGLPIRHMILASNDNNVLNEFFTTGVYDINHRRVVNTSSPSIDILKSSNLERYLYTASGNDYKLIQQLFSSLDENDHFSIDRESQLFQTAKDDFKSAWCTNEESMKTIRNTFQRTGYMIDPHTAVAKTVSDSLQLSTDVPLVISATAHFSKFAGEVLSAIGVSCPTDNPADLMNSVLQLTSKPERHAELWKNVIRPRYHKEVCEANETIIRDAIEAYLLQSHEKRRSTKSAEIRE